VSFAADVILEQGKVKSAGVPQGAVLQPPNAPRDTRIVHHQAGGSKRRERERRLHRVAVPTAVAVLEERQHVHGPRTLPGQRRIATLPIGAELTPQVPREQRELQTPEDHSIVEAGRHPVDDRVCDR
jgi:hypothetical protein